LYITDIYTLIQWATDAGLVESQAHFEDIYGLDPEVCLVDIAYGHEFMMIQLLGMVSKGVKAVTLLFPCSGVIAEKRKEEDEKIVAEGQPPIDSTIFWMKQTVCFDRPRSFILMRTRSPTLVEPWASCTL